MTHRNFLALSLMIAACAVAPSAGAEDRLPFIPFDGSDVAVAIREQFVSDMLNGEADKEAFSWQRLDLDGDGYDELIIKLEGPSLCFDNACPIIGFQRANDDRWEAILTAVGERLEFDAKTNVLSIVSGANTSHWEFGQ